MPKPRTIHCGCPSDPGGVSDFTGRDSRVPGRRRFGLRTGHVCFLAMNLHPSPINLFRRQQLQLRLSRSRYGRVLLYLGAVVRSRQNLRWHWRGIIRQFRQPRGRIAAE